MKKLIALFQWDGKINIGNILTVFAIIIAYRGFIMQKHAVDLKVDNLQAVVDSLENEKNERVLHDLYQEEKGLNHFSYNLSYTISQIRAIETQTNTEYIVILSELNKIIELLQKHSKLHALDLKQLNNLGLRNIEKSKVLVSGLRYLQSSEKFDSLYCPRKENYTSVDAYIKAQAKYNDTLDKHIKYLLKKLTDEVTEPKKKINELEQEFFNIEMNAMRK